MQVQIDMTAFRNAIGHDPMAEKMLLRLFIETVDAAFAGLSAEVPQEIWVSRFHLIKGAAGNVGALELMECAEKAEKTSHTGAEEKQGILNRALEIYAQFRAYYMLLAE